MATNSHRVYGCIECDWTCVLEARDERGLTVTWPCDCTRAPRQTQSPYDMNGAKEYPGE